MPDRRPASVTVGRRAAVLGVMATVVLGGCDHGDDIGGPAATGSPSAGTPTPSTPEQTPDEALVEEVLTELDAALAVLASARGLPTLRAVVTALQRAHRQHVHALAGEAEAASAGPLSPATALQAVRRSEKRLQSALVDAAGRAESGALAKLLASMSASATQHLAALPKEA